MVEMKVLEREKREELYKGIAQLGISIEDAKKVFEYLEDACVIEVTPPKMKESPLQILKIQATYTGRFSGKSYKPGNIIINIKDAMVESLALGFSIIASIGAISMSQPMIAIFTIISAVLSAANLGKIELGDNAVLILAVLWESTRTYGGDQLIDVEFGLELVNRYLQSCGREKISEVQYDDALEDLENVKCIVVKDGKIKLNEKIHIEY